MNYWALLPPLILVLLCIPGFLSFRRKKIAEILKPQRLMESTVSDVNDLDGDQRRAFGMIFYHYFEELWQEQNDCEIPSQILSRIFWSCSDDKLRLVASLSAMAFQVNFAPSPKQLVNVAIGAAALSELKVREIGERGWMSDRAYTVRKNVLNMIDDLCPTLQIGMWSQRFPNSQVMEKTSPLFVR